MNRALAHALLVLAFLLPATVVFYVVSTPVEQMLVRLGLPATLEVPTWKEMLVSGIAVFPAAFMATALLAARDCFKAFDQGRYFTQEVVLALRQFAARAFGAGVAGLLAAPLATLILTLGLPAGSRTVAFNASSSDLLTLLFAGIFWQIAAVMARAVAMAEDHAQIV
jgi:hypothetical protein